MAVDVPKCSDSVWFLSCGKNEDLKTALVVNEVVN